MTPQARKACEVCGKDDRKCAFERACSCWYGVPCVNGESMRQHERAALAKARGESA